MDLDQTPNLPSVVTCQIDHVELVGQINSGFEPYRAFNIELRLGSGLKNCYSLACTCSWSRSNREISA